MSLDTMHDPRLPARFWAKVEIGASAVHSQTGKDIGPCWIWTAGLTPSGDGYGWFWNGTRAENAHRTAYLALIGPTDLGLDHLCRHRRCVNPSHLEPVTTLVNVRRGNSGKDHAVKTACPRGHAYTLENTYVGVQGSGSPHRKCRTCHRDRARARSLNA